MTTMLDKLIEAIMDSGPVGCCTISEREAKEIARAALQAIREPDKEMIEAGEACDPGYGDGLADAKTHFTAMIDDLLKEGPLHESKEYKRQQKAIVAARGEALTLGPNQGKP